MHATECPTFSFRVLVAKLKFIICFKVKSKAVGGYYLHSIKITFQMLQKLFTMCNVALNQKRMPEYKGTLWILTNRVLQPPQHVNRSRRCMGAGKYRDVLLV